MADSQIEWTDKSWNPTVGCSKVSAGCAGCYAVRMAFRLQNMGQSYYDGLTVLQDNGTRNWTGEVRTLPKRLLEPLKWKKPVRVFVNSMSDLFHEDVPFEFVDQVFAVMALCPQHTFQVLTKRPERMAEWAAHCVMAMDSDANATGNTQERVAAEAEGIVLERGGCHADWAAKIWPLPNVWLGTSVEDQKAADERIPHLLQVPAAVRFLSCEPLLGSVDLDFSSSLNFGNLEGQSTHWLKGRFSKVTGDYIPNTGIGWVIAGGESGPGARPMHPGWARSLRDQCKDAGVPFFFKQNGEYRPYSSFDHVIAKSANQYAVGQNGHIVTHRLSVQCSHKYGPDAGYALLTKCGKAKAGRLLDGVEYSEFPKTEGANA